MADYPVFPILQSRPSTIYDLSQSIEKELSYLQGVVTTRTEVQFLDKVLVFEPARRVVVSDLILRRYSCLDYPGCGQCCFNFWNVHLSSLIPDEVFVEYQKGTVKYVSCSIRAGGEEKSFTLICYDHTKQPCCFEDRGCTIHKDNPISCMFPLVKLRFDVTTKQLYVTKEVFGRNWNMGCPVKWTRSYASAEEFENDTISRFVRFKKYLESMGMSHIVDTIIDKLRNKAKRIELGFV